MITLERCKGYKELRIIKLLLACSISLLAQNSITGIVKPVYQGKLSVSTDGIVSKIILSEGDSVKEGQVILKLDDKLQKLETLRRKMVLDDKTQIETLEKSLMIMKDIIIKKEKLYKDTKTISLNELNQLRIQYINTQGELETLKANEAKEEIEYNISNEVLAYYNLKSPIDGVITQIVPKIGEWVQTGKEIVTVVDTRTCFVEVDLDLRSFNKIALNSKVKVQIGDFDKTIEKTGVVKFISEVADSSSSLIRAKIYFDNTDKAVMPGTTASIIY